MKFFAKMNEQLQYTWNFQLSMLSLKNGFHNHLFSSSILSPHQCFTPIPKLAATTSKKKKEKKKKNNQCGNTISRRSCMLDLKMKENKRVLLENWRLAKHEEWWIYPSLSLSLSLSVWVIFSHTTPSATGQIHIIVVLQRSFPALFTKSRGGPKASSNSKNKNLCKKFS